LKPLFKVLEDKGKEVEGDFMLVEKKGNRIEFDTGLHESVIGSAKELIKEINFEQGSLTSNLFDNLDFMQGYILCEEGILFDVRFAFFLTKHKPLPTFAKAFAKGKNIVKNISGFFLPVYNVKSLNYDIVPHLHIVFENVESGKVFSGHLIDASAGRLKVKMVPLTGKTLKRDVDPNTGLMYLRTYPAGDFNPKSGDTILFAFGPREKFPTKLFKLLSKYDISKARIVFAVGTLTSAYLSGSSGEIIVRPREGLELAYTQGEVMFKEGSFNHKMIVHLTDRYGKQYKGMLSHGRVKELVEGLIKVEN
jgi:predicted DNA-binding protein with PD1-like motif